VVLTCNVFISIESEHFFRIHNCYPLLKIVFLLLSQFNLLESFIIKTLAL
jgi:hypothetical protein